VRVAWLDFSMHDSRSHITASLLITSIVRCFQIAILSFHIMSASYSMTGLPDRDSSTSSSGKWCYLVICLHHEWAADIQTIQMTCQLPAAL